MDICKKITEELQVQKWQVEAAVKLIDEGNTISANTAALYTASLTGGSNWYKETSGMKVLDGNGNNKVITALVWKTTTGETFELKTVG